MSINPIKLSNIAIRQTPAEEITKEDFFVDALTGNFSRMWSYIGRGGNVTVLDGEEKNILMSLVKHYDRHKTTQQLEIQ